MIDLAGMPPGAVRGPNASDFTFKVGTGADRSAWAAAPAPASVQVRRGAGAGGSDRITITWPDGAIKNQWLEVTVNANDVTGLSAPDVFTFGNLAGDAGDGAVNALDLGAVKRALNAAAGITSAVDFNRDGRVNALDLGAVKTNLNRSLSLQAARTTAPAAVFGSEPILASGGFAPARVWDEPHEDLLHAPL
jgi:hypothetical protein